MKGQLSIGKYITTKSKKQMEKDESEIQQSEVTKNLYDPEEILRMVGEVERLTKNLKFEPGRTFKLTDGETILNPRNFIDSHIMVVRLYYKNRTIAEPFILRLNKFLELI